MGDSVAVTTQAQAYELALVGGDLSKLTTDQRLAYYRKLCDSVGLNPYSQPFAYLELNKRLTLYAKKDAADQLRKVHGVNLKVTETRSMDGLYVVKVAAKDRHNREDEDLGAVSIVGLKGEALANAMLKATTKAKRRVTLSICGLGFLDETEAEEVEGARLVDGPYPTNGTPAAALPASVVEQPSKVEVLGSPDDWPAWVETAEEALSNCPTLTELRLAWTGMTSDINRLQTQRPDLFDRLVGFKDQRKADIEQTNLLDAG